MKFRFGRLEDESRVRALAQKQNLPVDIPLPSLDPAVAVFLVAENDSGEIELAIILRLGLEAHLIADPDAEDLARKFRAFVPIAEGAAIAKSEEMLRRGCPAITDVEAFVPEWLERMQNLMPLVGFELGVEGFSRWWKRLGG